MGWGMAGECRGCERESERERARSNKWGQGQGPGRYRVAELLGAEESIGVGVPAMNNPLC